MSLIAEGKAPKIPQTEEGASYEPMLNKKESSMVRLDELTGQQLHDFIRGCDKVPGAWITLDEQEVKLYGSKQWTQDIPNGLEVKVLGIEKKKIFIEVFRSEKRFQYLIFKARPNLLSFTAMVFSYSEMTAKLLISVNWVSKTAK